MTNSIDVINDTFSQARGFDDYQDFIDHKKRIRHDDPGVARAYERWMQSQGTKSELIHLIQAQNTMPPNLTAKSAESYSRGFDSLQDEYDLIGQVRRDIPDIERAFEHWASHDATKAGLLSLINRQLNAFRVPFNTSSYVPQKIAEHVYTFAVETETCPSCGSEMFDEKIDNSYAISQQAQTAGIREKARYRAVEGKTVCRVCAEQYWREVFECDHCSKPYPKSDIQWQYDLNGIGYLCKHCYNTLSAAEWDAAKEMVEAQHQYSD